MKNLEIYNKLKEVPDKAQKKITGGRLKGMTDIKPMWRIEKLTETFGICGIGWKTIIKNKEIIEGENGEKIAIVDIDLFVKIDDQWSEAIEGTGGSNFVSYEKNGFYTNDECFKMAYTDALSVACKSLGMGADVYWGDSKYNTNEVEVTKEYAENYIFTFGKHENEKLKDVIENDEGYIDWLLKKENTNQDLIKSIELLCGKKPPQTTNEDIDLTKRFNDALVETGQDLEQILNHYKVNKLEELSNKQKEEAIKIMHKKYKQQTTLEVPFDIGD